ncbi:hypothetical protein CAEBREN_05430 [Caenorhabditis brenneri]|uniref:Uncharacterized protein n=1 Tax=Caenorhabditis brenneri TaxID=135651 RepID=G0N1U3_CAEBE|nr:hypothetical protein CAEBREN_05430 [Caenorhabditis brenneri]
MEVVDNELPRKPSPELELAIRANKQTNRRRFVPSCIIRNAGQSEGPGLELPQGYLIPMRVYRYNNQKLIRLKPNQIYRLATRYNNIHWSVGCSKEPQYYDSPYQEWAKTKLDFVMFVHGTGQMVELEIGFKSETVSILAYWLNLDLTATTPSSTTQNILTLTSSFASESQQCVELT